jgi:hypothetical protein
MTCNWRGYHWFMHSWCFIPMICTRYSVIIQQDRIISCSHFITYNLSTTISMVHGSNSLRNKCKLKQLVFFVDICSIHLHEEVHCSNQTASFDDWCFERYTRDMMINVSWRFKKVQCISYNHRLLDRNMLMLWNSDTPLIYPISGWTNIRYFPQLAHDKPLSWNWAAPNKGDVLPSENRWIHRLFICRCEDIMIAR